MVKVIDVRPISSWLHIFKHTWELFKYPVEFWQVKMQLRLQGFFFDTRWQ